MSHAHAALTAAEAHGTLFSLSLISKAIACSICDGAMTRFNGRAPARWWFRRCQRGMRQVLAVSYGQQASAVLFVGARTVYVNLQLIGPNEFDRNGGLRCRPFFCRSCWLQDAMPVRRTKRPQIRRAYNPTPAPTEEVENHYRIRLRTTMADGVQTPQRD